MTTHTPHQLLVGVVFAASLVVCGANQTAAADDLTIFVALTDSEGEPVTDLAAKDFAILWDGVACDILEIEPLNRPVRVTVYFDNATESVAALPDMREGVRLFLDALPPDIEVAIGSIAGRPQLRSPYTTDREELLDAIGRIGPAGGAATFWDALYEEAERIDKDEDRQYTPVIVMVAVGGPEASSYARSQPFERGMERLFANGATVHTLLFTSPSGVGRQTGRNQSAWGADIAASTHGRFQPFVSSNAFRTLLPELAKDLARKNKLGQPPVSGDLHAAEGCVRPGEYPAANQARRPHRGRYGKREHPLAARGESRSYEGSTQSIRRTTLTRMAMGTRETDQPPLWIATSDLPTSPGHPFYARLTTLLDGHHFDRFVEGLCDRFYAPVMGRPSLAPGRYFRLLLVGYFEGIDSERGMAWRATDSLAVRSFLRLAVDEAPPGSSSWPVRR